MYILQSKYMIQLSIMLVINWQSVHYSDYHTQDNVNHDL